MQPDWLAVISYFGDISYFDVFSYAFCIKFRMILYFNLSEFLMNLTDHFEITYEHLLHLFATQRAKYNTEFILHGPPKHPLLPTPIPIQVQSTIARNPQGLFSSFSA
jgi:hypothetical protein